MVPKFIIVCVPGRDDDPADATSYFIFDYNARRQVCPCQDRADAEATLKALRARQVH